MWHETPNEGGRAETASKWEKRFWKCNETSESFSRNTKTETTNGKFTQTAPWAFSESTFWLVGMESQIALPGKSSVGSMRTPASHVAVSISPKVLLRRDLSRAKTKSKKTHPVHNLHQRRQIQTVVCCFDLFGLNALNEKTTRRQPACDQRLERSCLKSDT